MCLFVLVFVPIFTFVSFLPFFFFFFYTLSESLSNDKQAQVYSILEEVWNHTFTIIDGGINVLFY